MRSEIVAAPRGEIVDRQDVVAASEQHARRRATRSVPLPPVISDFHCTLPEYMISGDLKSGWQPETVANGFQRPGRGTAGAKSQGTSNPKSFAKTGRLGQNLPGPLYRSNTGGFGPLAIEINPGQIRAALRRTTP